MSCLIYTFLWFTLQHFSVIVIRTLKHTFHDSPSPNSFGLALGLDNIESQVSCLVNIVFNPECSCPGLQQCAPGHRSESRGNTRGGDVNIKQEVLSDYDFRLSLKRCRDL